MPVRLALSLATLLVLAGCPSKDTVDDDPAVESDVDHTDEGQIGDTEVSDSDTDRLDTEVGDSDTEVGDSDAGDSDVTGDTDSDVTGDTDSDVAGDTDSDVGGDTDTDVVGDTDSDVGGDTDSDVGGDTEPGDTDTADTAAEPYHGGDPTLPDADRDGWHADVDCDDAAPTVHPDAREACDGIDDDCDGKVDDDDDDVQPDAPVASWRDQDGDGFGDPFTGMLRCAVGPGRVANGGDCDDTERWTYPGSTETCGPGDEDCDGVRNDGDPSVDPATMGDWPADADADGFGALQGTVRSCSPVPGVSSMSASDCDDDRAAVHPGGAEVCDGLDDDCDGTVDDADGSVDLSTGTAFHRDTDGDGQGSDATTLRCAAATGWVAATGDCDDGNAAVFLGNQEICNGIDDDCDTWVDNADPSADGQGIPPVHGYFDDDHDGYGNPNDLTLHCGATPGFALVADDCDDGDPTVHPGATEVCFGGDEDCDGRYDAEDDSLDVSTETRQWRDADEDGYGADGEPHLGCGLRAGHALVAGDCDDANTAVHVDATEVCDGLDDDCDALVDDADDSLVPSWDHWASLDRDGDGWGTGEDPVGYCTVVPAGHAPDSGDCDDARGTVNPGAPEVCGGLDDDCDGAIDDADDSLGGERPEVTWVDLDDDGWGDGTLPTTSHCAADGPGWTGRPGDCADWVTEVSPDATEVCDGWDDDCDGLVDMDDPGIDLSSGTPRHVDADRDGYGDPGRVELACPLSEGWSDLTGDCDDAAVAVHVGATETCDGIDDDCDGFADDADPDIDPDQLTAWYADVDDDGYGDGQSPTSACTRPEGHVANADDCDDGQKWAHPGGVEVCDGVDDDCDGVFSEAGLATWDDGTTTPVDLTDTLADLDAFEQATFATGGRLHLCEGTWRPLKLNADVDVIGHGSVEGVVIYGEDRWPGVLVAGEQVTASVSHVTLEGGYGGNVPSSVPGSTGGIASGVTCIDDTEASWLALQDVDFGFGFGLDGGAMHVDGCNVDVFGGTWKDLGARRGGGALVAHGTMRMVGTTVQGLSAIGDGGVFYLAEGGALETLDAEILYGTAGGNGGVYYLSAGTTADLQCSVQHAAAIGATAGGHGGGAYLAGTGSQLSVSACDFGYGPGNWTHNSPEDVWSELLEQAFDGFGNPATFVCVPGGCTPP